MKKLRISYTLINLWDSNRTEDLINYYFKLKPFEPTNAMLEGQAYDELNNIEVKTNKRMIPQFGGIQLKNPKEQNKIVVPYKDFDIVAVPDVIDEPIVYECKTGVKSSYEYANGWQIPMYFVACFIGGIKIEKGICIRYDQKADKSDWTVIHNSGELMKSTGDMIEEKGNMIYEFFRSQGLL